MLSSGVVGLASPVADGSDTPLRQARNRELVVVSGHGDYAEPSSRGFIYQGMTTIVGTTVVAANNSPVAAAAATILTLYNPLNSGVNLELLRTYIHFISGNPGTGAFAYNMAWGQNITATQNNTGVAGAPPVCPLNGQSGKGKIFTQTALTGGTTAQTLTRSITSSFSANIAASSSQQIAVDEVRGEIVIPPGGLISIASPATGTNTVIVASFAWQESLINPS